MASPEFAVAVMLAFVVQMIANLRSRLRMGGWLKHQSEHITRGTMPDL